jgi:hypothetical protein
VKISSTHLLFRALSSFALLIFINSCFIELGAESFSWNSTLADTGSSSDSLANQAATTCTAALTNLQSAAAANDRTQDCGQAAAACLKAVNGAAGMCLSSSPLLSNIAPAIGAVGSLAELATDPAKMCSQGAKLMNLISAGLATYNGYCGVQQMNCSNACKTLAATCALPKDLESKDMDGADQALADSATKATNLCATACGNFLPSLAAAAIGAGAFLKTAFTANNCAAALDCTQPQNYSNPTCIANCTLAQNAQNPNCLCTNNPNDPSCKSAYQAGATTLGTTAVGGAAIGALHMPTDLGPGGPAVAPNIPVSGAGGSAAGLAGGSGSGGGGSGGGGSGGGPGAGPGGAARSASGGLAGAEAPGGLMPGGGSASNGKGGYADAAAGVGASNKFKGAMPTKSDRNTASASKEVGPRGKEIFDQMSNEYKVLGSTFYP